MTTEYQPLGKYGGQFSVRRVNGSDWVVVGECWFSESYNLQRSARLSAWRRKIQWKFPKLYAWLPKSAADRFAEGLDGQMHSLDIHLDKDDPLHEFLGPEAWPGWPNARKLSEWYSARHRKSMRMRERRRTSLTQEDMDRMGNEWIAMDALALTIAIKSAPNEDHQVGQLDWSPTGQVWKSGARWVKYQPEPA